MAQLEFIESIEKRLWSSADKLRANSSYASNEYFMPLMGILFLRHASNRFFAVKDTIEKNVPVYKGQPRPLTKKDFSSAHALYLRDECHFSYLVNLPSEEDIVKAVTDAMRHIEKDNDNLQGVLPIDELSSMPDDVLRDVLKSFDSEELRQASGDIFGRIYEYFLTQFANQGAHDNGEFFTPISLVQMIVNIIEPDHGNILDPACGSGGMFVQSGHFMELRHEKPSERCVFYGIEKNDVTIRLGRMNLAVHGLEGHIKQGITYYADPHQLKEEPGTLFKNTDFVMANPPFNVDEVNAKTIALDERLCFGLPGTGSSDKKNTISNANYLWINYFYSYLNEKGRAGFVMSSQSSSAGNKEAEIRKRLVATGAVDIMIDIRPNFFYTRSVPCQLWFFDRSKEKLPEQERSVLMIDARNTFRQVTRKICDFSPEQLQNLTSIVWLYRGERERFAALLSSYFAQSFEHANDAIESSKLFLQQVRDFSQCLQNISENDSITDKIIKDMSQQCINLTDMLKVKCKTFQNVINENNVSECLPQELSTQVQQDCTQEEYWKKFHEGKDNLENVKQFALILENEYANTIKIFKEAFELFSKNETIKALKVKDDKTKKTVKAWKSTEVKKKLITLMIESELATKQLQGVAYFLKQIEWLLTCFPQGEYVDITGLVRKVSLEEIAENAYSLTPGLYVGVVEEEQDVNFDFASTMQEIHSELVELNLQAAELAKRIQSNFEGLL